MTKDGVYYQGIKIDGALVNGKLKLSFVKGKADNPIVQGIIVYHASIESISINDSRFSQIRVF